MADDVYDVTSDQADDEAPQKPAKNFVLFFMDENDSFYPPGIYDGAMGAFPLLMGINVGYDPECEDPFMYPYESQEILFAYKKGAQKRILMRDKNNRTYSLPVESKIPFCLSPDTQAEMTISQILQRYRLPLFGVQFARSDRVEFRVDRQQEAVDSSYFGPLTLTRVYEEPYLYCLSIAGDSPRQKIIVLPRNLKDVALAPIAQIKGVTDFTSKLEEFKNKFMRKTQELETQQDPFFRELALVSPGPGPVEGEPKPYIESGTFISFSTPSSSDHRVLATPPHQTEPYKEVDATPTLRLSAGQPNGSKCQDFLHLEGIDPSSSQDYALDEDEEAVYCTLIPVGVAPEHGQSDHSESAYCTLTDVVAPTNPPAAASSRANFIEDSSSRCPPPLPRRDDDTGGIPDNYDVVATATSTKPGQRVPERKTTRAPATVQFPRNELPSQSSPSQQVTPSSLSQRPTQSPLYQGPPPSSLNMQRSTPSPLELRPTPSSQSQRPTQSPLSPVRIYGQDRQEHSDFVQTLTVNQVREVLRELDLSRHARSFAKKLVDGRMLVMLAGEKEVLMDEFRMTRFEFIRLRDYVREGHVPQRPQQGGCNACVCC